METDDLDRAIEALSEAYPKAFFVIGRQRFVGALYGSTTQLEVGAVAATPALQAGLPFLGAGSLRENTAQAAG